MKPLLPLILAVLFSSFCIPHSSFAAKASRPNVLFIAVDDMRDWAGFMGYAQAKTPNCDRLAKLPKHTDEPATAAKTPKPKKKARQ